MIRARSVHVQYSTLSIWFPLYFIVVALLHRNSNKKKKTTWWILLYKYTVIGSIHTQAKVSTYRCIFRLLEQQPSAKHSELLRECEWRYTALRIKLCFTYMVEQCGWMNSNIILCNQLEKPMFEYVFEKTFIWAPLSIFNF